MAEHGIEAVDLMQIQTAAGQRNRSAVSYHFGDRAGLVLAIIDKHRVALNQERHELLDAWEQTDERSLRVLLMTGVIPYLRRLGDPSTRDFMIIVSERAARLGTAGVFAARQPHSDSVERFNAILVNMVPGARAARERLVGNAVLTMSTLLADVARQINREQLTAATGRRRIDAIVDFVHSAITTTPDHHPASRPITFDVQREGSTT